MRKESSKDYKNFLKLINYPSKMPKEKFLSLNAMEKLLKQAGADRVSEKAKSALAKALEEKALEIGEEAKKLALHAGRKTITDKDINLAVKK